MVGGEKEIYDRCLPLFEKLGTNIQLQGPAGSGQHTKCAIKLRLLPT